ncbi:two-component response regulator ORR26-like [Neltuma alba]|uniref:two-component response regulator ORR26-like n=1 Tax=Neltuma alba TaxID=207710 RepID=UPI0010A3205E|nr:two-component response regulator ORR26-like [Prosopis alba]
MEGGRVSLFNCVPGLDFTVTATNQASAAIDLVCQQEGRFKLVMAKANMPGMNSISFLNTLLLKHITVIFISSGQDDGGAKAAFDKGSCYLLQEPIQSVDLISLWQQVYNSNNRNSAQENHAAKSKQKVLESSENQDKTRHDVRVKKKGKRGFNSNQVKLDNNNHAAEKEGEETSEHNNNRFPWKKPRISWTSDLHHKFVQAISVLGENNIRPKLIQEIMNVPYLTCRHIASHLQKFKSQGRHLQDKCNIDLLPGCKSSNFREGSESSSSKESQSYPCNPTLAAPQNENQSENAGCANFSCQYQPELVNYGNQDLEAVVRGAVPDTLMEKNQYDDFGNGFTEDDSAQNFETQTNPIFGDSSSSQKSDGSKPCCAEPSAVLGELEPCASMNQSQTLTEDKNIFRILGGDSEGYDCFRRDPDHISQNSDILSSYIHGHGNSDSCNPCFASLLKANPSAKSGNYNPSCVRPLKSKTEALNNQNQASTEYNNISGKSSSSPQSDYYDTENVRSLKAKPCSVVGGTISNALMDHDKTLTQHNNILRFLGDDSDAYGCFGNAPSSDDTAMLKYAVFR